jgi:hypothetical protein
VVNKKYPPAHRWIRADFACSGPAVGCSKPPGKGRCLIPIVEI